MPEMIQETVGGLVVIRGPLVEPVPPTPQELALQTIVSMERAQLMPRPTREFILAAMEREAAEMDITPEQLAVKNKGYRLLKLFDMQIATLREQL